MSKDNERSEFEAWFEKTNDVRNYDGHLIPPDIFKLDAENNYEWDIVHISYEAYQAAHESSKARIKELEGQNVALKAKVAAAANLVVWISKNISSAEYDAYERAVPVETTKGWKELTDAMGDGFLASYQEEFNYRDMHDLELFPEMQALRAEDGGK